MKTHELKCWPEYYDAVASGAKTFEIRKNDRDYQVGDTLILRRYNPVSKEYTGESLVRTVTYIIPLENVPGISVENGTIVMGLAGVGWTPCSVGLPEDNAKDDDGEDVRYLVTVKREYRSGYIGRYVCTAIYADVAWWSAETQSIIDDKETVIAWSQKPEPYRGGE